MPTQIDASRRYGHTVAEMTNLHSILHAAMYAPSGMPDAAMDGLWDAHEAVIEEIAKTPSANQDDVQAKKAAIDILTKSNEEAGTWNRHIGYLSESIAADIARLSKSHQPFLMAAE